MVDVNKPLPVLPGAIPFTSRAVMCGEKVTVIAPSLVVFKPRRLTLLSSTAECFSLVKLSLIQREGVECVIFSSQPNHPLFNGGFFTSNLAPVILPFSTARSGDEYRLTVLNHTGTNVYLTAMLEGLYAD